ncbi:MAG: hypothetical protein ACRDIU_02995 [Actinomycetota bacterium]
MSVGQCEWPAADILIAATAYAHDLPLYTHNRDDFKPFENLIEIKMV